MKNAKGTGFEPPKIALAICYIRVSTDEQSVGLDAQLDACTAAALGLGLELVGPFVDEGISGAAPLDRRPGLSEAVASVGRGDVFLVAKRDRIGRDPIIVAMIESAVIRKGGRVVSCAGEGTDDDSPTSILMRRVIDAFAEFERLMIRARTKAALGALKRRGRCTGIIPYGMTAIDDGVYSKTSIKAKQPRPSSLVLDAEETRAIQRMHQLHALGVSTRGIGKALDIEGFSSRSGRPWNHNSIIKILDRTIAASREPEGQVS